MGARGEKCDWDVGTIWAAAEQGNLEMVKYCVVKKCAISTLTCAFAAKNGHLRYSNTYTKSQSALGLRNCQLGGS